MVSGFELQLTEKKNKFSQGFILTFAHACADKSTNLPVFVGNMLIKLCFKGMTEAEIQSVSLSVNVFDLICLETLFYPHIDEWLICLLLTIHMAEGFYYKSV